MKGFWSFDWLCGTSKISIGGDDLYGPQDGQFMIFGKYPHSRSKHRVESIYETSNKKNISDEEKKARLEGLARVAKANYENEKYLKKHKIYPH